jgi:hypothetical protein
MLLLNIAKEAAAVLRGVLNAEQTLDCTLYEKAIPFRCINAMFGRWCTEQQHEHSSVSIS